MRHKIDYGRLSLSLKQQQMRIVHTTVTSYLSQSSHPSDNIVHASFIFARHSFCYVESKDHAPRLIELIF